MRAGSAITEELLCHGINAARRAPSLVSERIWSWRPGVQGLQLWLDRGAATPEDPDGRLLAYSCGAAVHHARVALAARGLGSLVYPFPDGQEPDCVAWLRISGLAGAGAGAQRMFTAMSREPEFARPGTPRLLDDTAFLPVAQAVHALGCFLTRLSPDEIRGLDDALRPRYALAGAGVRGLPGATTEPVSVSVALGEPSAGGLRLRPGEDRCATFALLSSPTDDPTAWFHAGQAWSAANLVAAELGLSVTVLPSTVLPGAAMVIYLEMPEHGWPEFVIWFGQPA